MDRLFIPHTTPAANPGISGGLGKLLVILLVTTLLLSSAYNFYTRYQPVEAHTVTACDVTSQQIPAKISHPIEKAPFIWPLRSIDDFPSFARFRDTACVANNLTQTFSLNDTLEFQQLLHDHQNPSDCSTKKFLILTNHWHFGYSSSLHVRAQIMLHAFSTERIFLHLSPEDKWEFAPTDCFDASPDCYFLPLSNCTETLPSDWRTQAPQVHFPDPRRNDPRYSQTQYVQISLDEFPSMVPRVFIFGEKYTSANRSYEWWMTQVMRYHMRTKPYVWPGAIHLTFN